MSKKFLIVVLIAFFAATLVTYLSGDYESLTNNIWNLLPPLFAAICGVMTVKVYGINNPHAKALAFLSLGVFFWFLGDFIWFILEYFYNKNPFPSVADYFYLLAYPILLVGLIQEVKSNSIKWTNGKALTAVLVSLIFGLIVFYFGIILAYDRDQTLLNNIIAISYGVGDLVLIIFSVAILMVALGYQKGRLFLPWLYVLVGFTLILAADILFAIFNEEYENFTAVRNLDLGWISGFLLLGFGFFSIGNALKEARQKLLGKTTAK